MKQEIEIYLHSAGTTEEKIIKVPDDATLHSVIEAAKQAGFAVDSDMVFMIEDAEDVLTGDVRLCDCGVRHKHHIHCHKCHQIEVKVHYNGQEKTRKFTPSRKVKGVLHWAVEAFGLHGVDAENKELRLGSAEGTILGAQQHIGSYVRTTNCEIAVFLTAIVEVQG